LQRAIQGPQIVDHEVQDLVPAEFRNLRSEQEARAAGGLVHERVQQEVSRVVDLLDEEVMLKTLELENFGLRAQIDLNQKHPEVSRRVMMNGGGGESRIQAGAEGTGSDGHESGHTDGGG
jgi:hypothetical protein